MRRKKGKGKLWIAAILIGCLGWTSIASATPVTSQPPQQQPAQSPQQPPQAQQQAVAGQQPAAEEQVYVHTEGFVQDHSMSGLFSQCTEYFSAEKWNVKNAKFTMIYNVTQLKDKDISDFTVSLNGEPFYSGRFEEASGERKKLELALPVRLIKDGVNELKIESYVRTRDSLPCVDDVSMANWFNVSKDSAIEISYTTDKKTENIADIYQHLTSIYALEQHKAAVIVPDTATDKTMTAAANILIGISKNAKMNYENLQLVPSRNVFEKDSKMDLDWAVYVGEWKYLPSEIQNAMPAEAKKGEEEGAALALVTVGRMHILVLTGEDSEQLEKGAKMFGNADYMKQMTGNVHVISKAENPIMEKKDPLEYFTLSEEGSYVNGAFRQTFTFSQSAYANKLLSPKSEIYLKVRYSKNLDFERSLMTIYVNDIPIGSHKLSKEKADGDEVGFYIPADLKVSGDFQVKVAFDLEIEDVWCTLRQGETPWAYITSDSMMKIVVAGDVPLAFQNYPAPFLKNKSVNHVLIALSEKPSEEELKILQGVCLTLGRFQEDNTGELKVKQGAKKNDCNGKNVIVIGTFEDNALVRAYNQHLYFQFSEDGKRILTNEKKRITEEGGATMGTLQLLPASKENQGMLFITGATRKAMKDAATYVSDTEKLWEISGDGCIVREEEVESYQFAKQKDKKMTTVKELIQRDDMMHLLIVSFAVAVVLIIGLLLILRKYMTERKTKKIISKRKGKKDEEK